MSIFLFDSSSPQGPSLPFLQDPSLPFSPIPERRLVAEMEPSFLSLDQRVETVFTEGAQLTAMSVVQPPERSKCLPEGFGGTFEAREEKTSECLGLNAQTMGGAIRRSKDCRPTPYTRPLARS